LKRRLIYAMVLLAAMTTLGTVGFLLVEPTITGPFEAFYFTIVTMFTVGYGDFVPTTTISRLLAMIVVVGGVTAAVTVLQSIFDLVVTKDIRRELGLPERRTKMKDHIIICGYGNVGQRIYEQLKVKNEAFLFIESDPQKIAELVDKRVSVIQGNAGDEDVLERANVKEAKTLILTLRDSDNIIVTIMAKMLNPNVFIVSEVEDMRNVTVIKKAGADEVVHCHEMGARTMVSKARKIVIDPVCGAEVDPRKATFTTDFNGMKYYFDSQECKDAFVKNPDRFMEMQRVVEATCAVR
jgi:voltage-gated potassium channel